MPSYVASKHAIVALTDSLRLQLTALGASTSVTALCPGGVSTGIDNRLAEVEGMYLASPEPWQLFSRRTRTGLKVSN